MTNVAEDVKDMLVAESSLGLTFGENLFISREPTTPAETVTLFDTTGVAPELTLQSDKNYAESLQIRVRANSYLEAMSLCRGIAESLQGRAHETLNGSYYNLIQCSNPALLDWDDNNRIRIVINVEIQRR